MKCLIIGGAGFIGSHLTRKLVDEGHEVRVVDWSYEGKLPAGPEQVRYFDCDALSSGQLRSAMLGCDTVFHLAAIPSLLRSYHCPLEAHQNNAGTVVHALSLAAEYGVPHFVFASSWTVYGRQSESPLVECMWPRPLSPYALSKWVGEEWCRLFARLYPDLSTLCLRLFNVYGPGAKTGVVNAFVERAKTGQSLTVQVKNGESGVRDFVHVSDVVGAFLKADEFLVDKPGYWGVVNVGTGVGTSVLEVAETVQPSLVMIDVVGPSQQGPVLCVDGVANTQKAKALLGWQAEVPLERGIQEALK